MKKMKKMKMMMMKMMMMMMLKMMKKKKKKMMMMKSSIGGPGDHVSRTITPACPGITSRGRSPHTAQGPFEHTQPEALLNRNDYNNIFFHTTFPNSNSTLPHGHPTTHTSWQTSTAAEITPFW